MRKAFFLLSCLAVVVISGCHGESNFPEATGKGTIRAINAIKTSPTMDLLIEERRIDTVAFKSTTRIASHDDLEYIFNVEARLAGDIANTRVASHLLDVVKDTEYTLIFSGALDAPDITVWELPKRDWGGSETVFELRIGNTADTLGDVDVYFSAPGIAPMLGNAVGTLSFGEVLPVVDYETGDYVVIFTAAGNPSIVHFESGTFPVIAQSSMVITIFDADANETGPWSVRGYFAGGGTAIVSPVNATSTARFFHASTALLTADIFNDETLTAPPIVTNHAFGDVTGDLDLPAGPNLLFYTDPVNTGAPLLDGQVTVFETAHKNVYAVGDVDALQTIEDFPDRRSVETLAKFSVLNSAINHPSIDFYIVTTGDDIADVNPAFVRMTVGSLPEFTTLNEGNFEMYVTTANEKTVITGPIPLDSLFGDVFEYVIYDNVLDPMTADLVSIPLP